MTKNTKIFLGVGCGVLLIVGIVVVVGGLFAMKRWGERVFESTSRFEEAGREFGKTTDQQGCMKEAVERSKSSGLLDVGAGIGLTAFVDSCLKACRPTANFCDGVPSFFSMNDSEWAMDECEKVGVDAEKTGCVFVMKSKHDFCRKPR